MPQYPTPKHVEVILPEHPDADWRNRALDIAHFELYGGDTPIHVYNYARRGQTSVGQNIEGEQGGAVFDDTVLGNRIAEIDLFVNMTSWETVRTVFRPQTRVGDILVLYRLVPPRMDASAPQPEEWGYLLTDGRVQQAGTQIEGRSQSLVQVQVKGRDLIPLPRGRATPIYEEETAADLSPTTEGGEAWIVSAYGVRFRPDEGGPRLYNHLTAGTFTPESVFPALVPQKEFPLLREGGGVSRRSLEAALASLRPRKSGPLAGAVLVVDQSDVYVWSRARHRYVPVDADVSASGQYDGDLQLLQSHLFTP
jgi:hypothetical protein